MLNIKLVRQKKQTKNHSITESLIHKNHCPIKIQVNLDQQWKHTSKLKNSPSATFGKSLRESPAKSLLFKPGPGSYQLEKSDFDKKAIQPKNVRNSRYHTENIQTNLLYSTAKKSEIYNSTTQHKIQPKNCFFSSEFQQDQLQTYSKMHNNNQISNNHKQTNPGPGSYELSVSLLSSSKHKFPKAARKLTQDNCNPGPGDYKTEISMLNREGGTMSRQKRLFKFQTQSPGPGYYKDVSINSIKKKESFAIINRSMHVNSVKNCVPGPGHYLKQQSIKKVKIIGGVIGRQQKPKKKEDSPSPLSYSPSFKDILSKSRSVVIGKSNLITKSNVNTPGPGHYKIERQTIFPKSSSKKQLNELVKTNITINMEPSSKHKQNRPNNLTKSHI